MPVVVPWLSLALLVSGLLLGMGTHWGLLRYWWVLVKLLLSLLLTVLVFVALVPAVSEIAVQAAAGASAEAVRESLGPLPTMLFFPPVVSFLMLSVASALSVYKPWRHTPWSREGSPAARARG